MALELFCRGETYVVCCEAGDSYHPMLEGPGSGNDLRLFCSSYTIPGPCMNIFFPLLQIEEVSLFFVGFTYIKPSSSLHLSLGDLFVKECVMIFQFPVTNAFPSFTSVNWHLILSDVHSNHFIMTRPPQHVTNCKPRSFTYFCPPSHSHPFLLTISCHLCWLTPL